jgi:cytochrome c oxidase subunit 2
MDLLPDGVNTLVLQADEPGTHRSQCAEFCGLRHADMKLTVVAEPAEQFESWVADLEGTR